MRDMLKVKLCRWQYGWWTIFDLYVFFCWILFERKSSWRTLSVVLVLRYFYPLIIDWTISQIFRDNAFLVWNIWWRPVAFCVTCIPEVGMFSFIICWFWEYSRIFRLKSCNWSSIYPLNHVFETCSTIHNEYKWMWIFMLEDMFAQNTRIYNLSNKVQLRVQKYYHFCKKMIS